MIDLILKRQIKWLKINRYGLGGVIKLKNRYYNSTNDSLTIAEEAYNKHLN